jgi:hypothetical protein
VLKIAPVTFWQYAIIDGGLSHFFTFTISILFMKKSPENGQVFRGDAIGLKG